MLLAEPPETEYDLRFSVMGFPVRIAWTFWLGAIVIGHSWCLLFTSPSLGLGPLMIGWTLCLLLSILIHELGHALAFRYYGINATIVLYHFGGLAIPNSSMVPGRGFARLDEKQDLVIAAAGPALQLLSAAVVIGIVKLGGYEVLIFQAMPAFFRDLPWVTEGNPIDSRGLLALVSFYIMPSVLWAFLNLVPVWPLDGGRIARSLIVMGGGTIVQSLWVSVIASGALAVWAFQSQNMIMGIFFGMFAFSSYQMIDQTRGGWR